MATYFVDSGAAGTASGADWTNAFLTLTAGLAAATASGDIIKVHKTHQETLAAATTYTAQNNISIICVDKDASDALAEMGASYWIGHSSTYYAITMAGAFRVYCYGLTFRTAGSGAATFGMAQTDGTHRVYENCLIWFDNSGSTASGRGILIGTGDIQCFVHLKNCTIRYNASSQHQINLSGRLLVEGGSVSSLGGAPSPFIFAAATDNAGAVANFVGFDASHLGSGTLVGNFNTAAGTVRFVQCKLGSGYTALGTQTHLNFSSVEVLIHDCATGDTHGRFEYHNAMGSVVSDQGIYFTSGAAAQSWKITATANCSFSTPFVTPWIGWYHSGTSSITPRLEILRDGSTTAFTDAQVWSEWSAKVTPGTVIPTFYDDRQALSAFAAGTAGVAQANGAGLGSWTGESGTAWSGKLDSGSAFIPAEVGDIAARVCVGDPSITVYINPEPLT